MSVDNRAPDSPRSYLHIAKVVLTRGAGAIVSAIGVGLTFIELDWHLARKLALVVTIAFVGFAVTALEWDRANARANKNSSRRHRGGIHLAVAAVVIAGFCAVLTIFLAPIAGKGSTLEIGPTEFHLADGGCNYDSDLSIYDLSYSTGGMLGHAAYADLNYADCGLDAGPALKSINGSQMSENDLAPTVSYADCLASTNNDAAASIDATHVQSTFCVLQSANSVSHYGARRLARVTIETLGVDNRLTVSITRWTVH